MEKKKTAKEGTDLFVRIIKASVSGNPKPNKEVKKLKDAEIALERAGKLDDAMRKSFNELKDKAVKKKPKK